jgi:hypothetical protein
LPLLVDTIDVLRNTQKSTHFLEAFWRRGESFNMIPAAIGT